MQEAHLLMFHPVWVLPHFARPPSLTPSPSHPPSHTNTPYSTAPHCAAPTQVPPCKVAVNTEFLDIFQINVAVRIRLKSSNQMRQTAILIRDPQRHLMRGRSGSGGGWGTQHGGAALGAEAAQERILQASLAAHVGQYCTCPHQVGC